jgi:uncharacterized protein involved in exopolysaccharide biosynthesis
MEDQPASSGSGPPAKAVVESVFRYRHRLFATFATVMSLVALYALLAPRHYISEMNVLVRSARPDYQITPERSNGTLPQIEVTEERINSEIEVLRSRDVADRVVEPNWTTVPAHTPSELKAHDRAVDAFYKHLKVELLRKSNVIHVAIDARSPQLATATVERLLEAFLAKQHELERSASASAFFAAEQARYKRQLDEAQASFADFQQEHDIVTLPDKEAALEQQIVDLQQQQRATRVQIGDLAQRLAADRRQLAATPPRLVTQQRSVPNLLALEQLATMLTTYKNQRTALLTKFPPTDRLVLEVDQQIANTQAALNEARDINPAENATDINPLWQQIQSSLTQNNTDLIAARTHAATLDAQIADLSQTLAATEAATVDFNTLQARVTELQANFQLYTQKHNEAQVANAMDEQQLVNVAIAERPTFSTRPSSPRLGLTLSFGSIAALFFAVCSVFFAEMGRDTVATPAELEALSSAPVLATFPLLITASSAASEPTEGGSGARSPRRATSRRGFVPEPFAAHRSAQQTEVPEPQPPRNTPGKLNLPHEGIA